MGNSSSQLNLPPEYDDIREQSRSMASQNSSWETQDYDRNRSYGPHMSPSPGANDDDGHRLNESNRPDPSRKKKKKRRKSMENAASREGAFDQGTSDNGDASRVQTKRSKKKSRKKSVRHEEPSVENTSKNEGRNADGGNNIADGKIEQPEAQDVLASEGPTALPKRKSKKSKKNATRSPQVVEEPASNEIMNSSAHADQPATVLEPPQPSSAIIQSPQQRKARRKNQADHSDSAAPPPPSSQAINSSSQPSMLQRPRAQSQSSELSASHIKTEEPSNDEDESLLELDTSSAINANSQSGGNEATTGWLHKRGETESNGAPAPDTRTTYRMIEDATLPDLQPNQIKSERQSDTDSDSDAPSRRNSESRSPSAARADRLTKSRSRSASKASTSHGEGRRVTDEALGINTPTASISEPDDTNTRASTPYSGPSTGSDHSIPPQLESQSTSRSLEPAEQRLVNGSYADNDFPNSINDVNARASPTKEQARRTVNGNGETSESAYDAEKTATSGSQASPNQQRKQARSMRTKEHGSQSNDPAAERDKQVLSDWGNGKKDQNLQPATLAEDPTPRSSDSHNATTSNGHASEVEATANLSKQPAKVSINGLQSGAKGQVEASDAGVAPEHRQEPLPASLSQNSTKKRRPKSSFFENESMITSQEVVASIVENDPARNDSVEPEQSASQPQPKSKRKRKLHPKMSLTLSQLEGEDLGEGESRLSAFSQRSKRKNTVRDGSNELDQSELGVSQEAGARSQQQRKPRKKRRTHNAASDDEMESLLAAGPSKTRKRCNNLDLGDDEEVRAAKRKRLSKASGGAATGAWTAEELETIEKVYTEFRDANGMTVEELNDMIHARPDKANNLHQEFWNRADISIPQRTRKQIVERTRRLYNNFTARGTWTDEQKAELHELFETHGNKFSHIAGLINRDQKDVRDYWRNHFVVHETRVKARWTKEEEARLKEVVEEALSKIRIQRENSGELRTRPRAAGDDDESLLDWHHISAGMNLTRSRAQCKWKWIDMREKGLVGDAHGLTQAPSSVNSSSRRITDISDELLQARESYDRMDDEDRRKLIEAIHACKATDDANIPWSRLVDTQFRAKWTRPTLRLAWYRLRRSVPDYDDNTVEDNARYLLNHIANFEEFPLIRLGHIDDLGEEKLIHPRPGSHLWKRPSQDLRAIAERQRRASKMRRNEETPSEGVVRWLRDSSVDLGDPNAENEEDTETGDEEGIHGSREDVPIRIPRHLKGEAAKKALAEARAKVGERKGKEPARAARSASVAIDSDSD